MALIDLPAIRAGKGSVAFVPSSMAKMISGESLSLTRQVPENAGDRFECGGNGSTSPTRPLRSTSAMNSTPHTRQLIEDRLSEISSAPRCFRPSALYFFSVTTIRSFEERWPIMALGMSEPHFTF
ncbi:MAG TPA: hypothetical protein VKR55_05315 [Bradyrhizobium sp.]|uniref:hypothetical protein n=1 Tax=Bradyrhizobium sp. TaxID=376 RepID=UPI002C30E062|nr:hypothetical protein [Bradyrhizobium sp.]HLZ01557.1 hypothetical protein [Bradyrhizobium sp.]